MATETLITPNPRVLDVTDACTALNHFFADPGYLSTPAPRNDLAFPWGQFNLRAWPAPRSNPKPHLYFLWAPYMTNTSYVSYSHTTLLFTWVTSQVPQTASRELGLIKPTRMTQKHTQSWRQCKEQTLSTVVLSPARQASTYSSPCSLTPCRRQQEYF